MQTAKTMTLLCISPDIFQRLEVANGLVDHSVRTVPELHANQVFDLPV